MNRIAHTQLRKEQGYVLITTLILMIMLTVMALTQVSMNSSQTRVAANASDSEVGFEKTEGAINEAINSIINGTYNSDSFMRNNNGFYLFDANAAPIWKTVDWTNSNSVINSFNGQSGSNASYILEKLPSVIVPGQNMKTPANVYRITARSTNASGNSSILIQSTLQIQQ